MTDAADTLRVCFISPKAYPIFNPAVETVFGGAEVDLYLLATELAKDPAYQVSFIVADYGQPDGEVRDGVRLLKTLTFRENAFAGAIKIWRGMQRADADIYMHEAASMGTALAAAFCRRHRRAFVYRTASSRETDGAYFSSHRISGFFVRRGFCAADVVIVQNDRDGDSLRRTVGIAPIVIRNACRLPAVSQTAKDSILWAGRSLPVKRPDMFLDLAKAFPQQRFVMICQEGTGDADYPRLVRQAEAIDNLTFLRRVPYHEIDRYFERAAVFVNTSESEGFPNAFIQAAAAGAAILSYAVNPDDFLTRYRCGLSCSANFDTLTQQLASLLDHERYRELGQNARHYAEQTHDINRIIERYKTLFCEAARPRKGKRIEP
jgi:glycosyltransferase involved in cell wall biosynthesis